MEAMCGSFWADEKNYVNYGFLFVYFALLSKTNTFLSKKKKNRRIFEKKQYCWIGHTGGGQSMVYSRSEHQPKINVIKTNHHKSFGNKN
jgi:hypothetical protein